MTGQMLIFGMGYTASRLAERLRGEGWQVQGTSRAGGEGMIAFDDVGAVRAALGSATHILSSVPPSSEGSDPVPDHYGADLASPWIGYLSSTGVYGDTGGAWVDESAPIGGGVRDARVAADRAWQQRAHIFRLPGIYGPGRSALDRVREGRAHRIDLPGQIFSRVHVDDIVSGIIAGFDAPRGIYNLADDQPCSQNIVIEYASQLLGRKPPPLQSLEDAGLSTMARSFYAQNRRISNRKAKRLLGWKPLYSTYKQGLDAIFHNEG